MQTGFCVRPSIVYSNIVRNLLLYGLWPLAKLWEFIKKLCLVGSRRQADRTSWVCPVSTRAIGGLDQNPPFDASGQRKKKERNKYPLKFNSIHYFILFFQTLFLMLILFSFQHSTRCLNGQKSGARPTVHWTEFRTRKKSLENCLR